MIHAPEDPGSLARASGSGSFAFLQFGVDPPMRPGTGQKSAATVAYQASRRGQVEAIVTDDEWAKVIRAQLRQAKRGNVKAFCSLTPWVMGAEPKEIRVTVDIEARVRALALQAGYDPDEALIEAQRILALSPPT
jgi:hypothetical protein